MPQESLVVSIRTADSAVPVRRASVVVTTDAGQELGRDEVTNQNGSLSRAFFLNAPDESLSLSPGQAQPYSTYTVTVTAPGFYSTRITGVQMFTGDQSRLPIDMIPRGNSPDAMIEFDVGPHGLRTAREGTPTFPAQDADSRVLSRVFIPEEITVHLGAPQQNAPNVTVPFVDYIKNVACSEIYPTWPEESLRANILCQISIALNRIFTEWYPSRGYAFDITNSTAYDQYFVYGRNIFENVARIVDDIFNRYIRMPGRINPFYAEYCNGTTVTCPGLSQWGTVTLANQGLSAEQILRYYYGNVEVAQTNEIQSVEESYPGTPLKVGSSGTPVRTIQMQLNRIRQNYPSIPAITALDGIFGDETRAAVQAFQRIFNLSPDGVVGKSTWYRISYIYVAVKKLAELRSEGENPQYDDETFPGILRRGSRGESVENLQFYLRTVAAFNPFIQTIDQDGFFGIETENAVRAFQSAYQLSSDGVVGSATWSRLLRVYNDVTMGGRILPLEYPGTPLKVGSSGDEVLYMQSLLSAICEVFPTIPCIAPDGSFGARTANAVREFQRIFGLAVDGVIGENTWDEINQVYAAVVSDCLDDGETVTGRILRVGSSGADVSSIQRQLNTVSFSLAPMTGIAVDGQYGARTAEQVRIFQRLTGLTADGVVGNLTRTRLQAFVGAVENNCLPRVPRAARAAEPLETAAEPLETAAAEKTDEPSPAASVPAQPVSAFRRSESDRIRAPHPPYRPLGPGSVGYLVRVLKVVLKEKGFGEETGMLSDLYGDSTARAVRRFQESAGLAVTGEVDADTWNALF